MAIIDKIRISGTTYDIGGSGGNNVVELTQAEYDALETKDPTAFYIITDAQAGDLTNYYTKTETNTLLGGKQKTLVSGTNISITTGETADTINCTLRAANASGDGSLKLAFLGNTLATGYHSVATGYDCKAKGNYSFASGRGSNTNNYGECAVGFNNKSVGTSTSIGENSGCTLFSVGNGQGTTAAGLHNAFEIRQNGDIYITLDGQDVKLQDKLGGTVDTEITSASTNPVTSSAIYNQLGGLKFVKLTQTEYDALATKDDNTMYVIVPAPPVPKVTAKYNITDTTNPTLILYYDTFGITSMIVDGGTPESVTGDSYQFSTTGEHTVEFILSSTTVPYHMFGSGFSDIPLTSVAFSDAITSMGSVFPGCENLTNIDWGNGVTSLTMEGNFKSCRGLTSIVFPEQLVNFSAGDEVYDTYTDSSITSVTFSNRLTTFNTVWTMNPSSNDFEVHLGSNITKVIFDTDSSSLPTKFYIEATTPPITELSEGISSVDGFTLYVPASAVSAYQADENWSNYATGGIQAIPTT